MPKCNYMEFSASVVILFTNVNVYLPSFLLFSDWIRKPVTGGALDQL